MAAHSHPQPLMGQLPHAPAQHAEPCILVLFGASGDLTRRLLIPALYNMCADGLLPDCFALIGTAREDFSSAQVRTKLGTDLHQLATRKPIDEKIWHQLADRLHYIQGDFADAASYERLGELITRVESEQQTGGNLLFYLATPPSVFGLIARSLAHAGLHRRKQGWSRLIIEKPFGHDLASARALNRELLADWSEDQIYRIDHYLGKETVQNLLTFRFSNGLFEPLWNRSHIDHIQFTVSETVGVEGRGAYYDGSGVLRDMIQNHMFQMLAYLCMEPPASFRPEAVRNEKAKLLEAVRIMGPQDVARNTARGQYGPGKKPTGEPAVGYRQESSVPPTSTTETLAALRLYIDNWRWEGVPIYLRSGKALWKRGTEIVVQFRRAPEVIYRDTPTVDRLEPNRLVFHIQPDQGIELRLHAKTPGPQVYLQTVNMRFDYQETFESARGTGYEILLYNCMKGDSTLFSRSDLVETAWRIAQPILDAWAASPASDFPNHAAGSWGPRAMYDLIAQDGRRWLEILNRSVLEAVPLFQGGHPTLLRSLAMTLKPVLFSPGEMIVRKDEPGQEMYFICRGQVEVLDEQGRIVGVLSEGEYFGELSLLFDQPRMKSIRTRTDCDLFVLERSDFKRILHDHPQLGASLLKAASSRYSLPQ